MYYYRISKYNPKFRDNHGNYILNDWTSFSDIGKEYLGKTLTLEEYKRVEDLYIDFVLLSMQKTDTDYLVIQELEKNGSKKDILELSSKSKCLYQKLDNNLLIGVDNISMLLQLQLRDLIWAKLISESLTVHFGYDYYMYVISTKKLVFFDDLNLKNDIYVEEGIKSPYEQ